MDEARITGQLEHPSIVPVYEMSRGDDGKRPFYTMRFIKGRTLSEAVRDYHRHVKERASSTVEFHALLNNFVSVCNAVAYAHSRGVIHRDLKGQNVIVGEYGEVILLDWGLAKLADRPEDSRIPGMQLGEGEGRGETLDGEALGTPAYIPPEQAEGKWDKVEKRSDVYGLGAILYEILTGRPPFDGENTAAVLRRVIQEPPERPRSVNAKTPKALEAVCLKALAKKPEDRFASAADLAAEVRRYLADEPVTSWREPWTTRTRRWMSRNRTAVIAGAAATLVAIAGLIAGVVFQARANRELQLANDAKERAITRAETQYDFARQAVEAFYSGVSEDVMLRQPQLSELRARLLKSALSFYQRQEESLRKGILPRGISEGWLCARAGRGNSIRNRPACGVADGVGTGRGDVARSDQQVPLHGRGRGRAEEARPAGRILENVCEN